MANELQRTLPTPRQFVWERDYAPLWTGSDCSAFWLAPEPDDILTIDGVRATLREHTYNSARKGTLQ